MSRSGIKGYEVVLRFDMKTPTKNIDETIYKGVTYPLSVINKTSYNELTIFQKETVCYQIVEGKREIIYFFR